MYGEITYNFLKFSQREIMSQRPSLSSKCFKRIVFCHMKEICDRDNRDKDNNVKKVTPLLVSGYHLRDILRNLWKRNY